MDSIWADSHFSEHVCGLYKLETIVIPEGVTEIKWNAFAGCNTLSKITIPKSTTTIGSAAFNYCIGLQSIVVLAETPPMGAGKMFDESSCPIYVPAGSVEAYKAAQYWSDYADRIQAIQE